MTELLSSAQPSLRTRFREGIRHVFEQYQTSDPELRTLVACVLLVRNSTTLLYGLYGTGKTQLVHLLRKVFFDGKAGRTTSPAPTRAFQEDPQEFGHVACTQDLTPMDTLFRLDLAKLMHGDERVSPRAVITARFKFVNEVQRASSLVHNALLPLLAERRVTYRDQVFESPDFICFLDANPMDIGSAELPGAFVDRIDYSFNLRLASSAGLVAIQERTRALAEKDEVLLAHLATWALTAEEMETVWREVAAVPVSLEMEYLLALVGGYLQRCVAVDRSRITGEFELPCTDCPFRAEVCAKLREVPGVRFLLSLMRLAQARAWLRGAPEVEVEDLLYGLPYALAHRLKVKLDSARLFPNLSVWVREELYLRGVRGKVPRWLQAIQSLTQTPNSDDPVLLELAQRDLAVADLVSSLTGKQLREVH